MKSDVERLREKAEATLARAEDGAADYVAALIDGTADESGKTWAEVTVRAKAALALAGFHHARTRAKVAANAGPKLFGVVLMPARIDDQSTWEQRAKALDSQGRPVIDTTAGPVALVKGEK